ncbi:MAG: phosphoribosylformimino-5-aminoimidazole carboxamide ribotide isomerase [Parasphingorhabdus sp.]|jgi:phosphoribosylformimino-5-aminoimidazole carboxamide ribotide isomerase
MLVIPAIDIQNGHCVRLRQGDMQDSTVFSENPVEMAARWVEQGARRLHIVDLDGAKAGKPVNTDIVHQIVVNHPDLPVQIGGGIRDEDAVEAYLETGVRYVIIGTKAVNEPHFVSDLCAEFPGHVIVGLDAKDGKVATEGWSKLSRHDVIDMALHFENDGVEAIIYTDISRDGMLSGVNIETTQRLAEAIHIPVIASGGVNNLADIQAVCSISDSGISGVIAGRSLYEGTLNLSEAQDLADASSTPVFGE